jgi:hypothetical protein
MPRITRAKVHRHLVAVDTNILWHKTTDVVVAPEIEESWDTHSGKFDL